MNNYLFDSIAIDELQLSAKRVFNDLVSLKKEDEKKYQIAKNALKQIFLQKDQIPFENAISSYQKYYERKEKEFLAIDSKFIASDSIQYAEYLLLIIHYYSALCFGTKNENLVAAFKKLKLPGPKIQWIVPLQKITNELNKIGKNEKFLIIKSNILPYIFLHVRDKILAQIVWWGIETAPQRINLNIKKYYNLFFRRLIDGHGKLKSIRNEGEYLLQFKMQGLLKDVNVKQFRKMFNDKLFGRTERVYLKAILGSVIPIEKVSADELRRSFFHLFRIICVDKQHKFLTEQQFDVECERRRKMNKKKATFYDSDYEWFQSQIVKEVILKQ